MATIDRALVGLIAERHRLPAALVEAVIMVESEGNPWAVRYEQEFYERYVSGKGHERFAPCSRKTEERARSMSWGLMQVMGQTAREEGFGGVYLSELCDPAIGIDIGCRHLATQAKNFPPPLHGWDAVCAAYNGGKGAVRGPQNFRNPEYPDKVLRALGGHWPPRGAL